MVTIKSASLQGAILCDDMFGHIINTKNIVSDTYVHRQHNRQRLRHLQDYKFYLSQITLLVEP